MEVGGQRHSPAALPCGVLWMGAENLVPLPPQGFDPRTLQPVVSRYTDWTIPDI
jgi:hypothetical protein